MMAECLPARKQGLKQRAEESRPLIVTIEKVGGTYQGGGQLRLESLLNVGSRGSFKMGGRGNGGG